MYSTTWTHVLELLTELDNAEDQYAVAICKEEDTVIINKTINDSHLKLKM